MLQTTVKLNDLQIETIIDKIVPLIADVKDHEFFRAILRIKAEESSSTAFAAFIGKMMKSVA